VLVIDGESTGVETACKAAQKKGIGTKP